ncbi:MAG: hypothetical protein LAO79_20300, partial [Acidobacteriia bacterium]|nr:hypothetical protein [Terriglobia bacterium]
TASGDKISIDVVQRDKTGTGQSGQISGPVKLPDWVPGYPGATPESMNSFGYELEKRIAYTFRSTDDPAKVLTWFARKLTEAGVHITASYTGSHGGFVHTNTADGRRMFNVEAAAPGTAPIFHVELREIKDGQ